MDWLEFLILLVLFIVTGARIFFRKKVNPDEEEVGEEEVLLDDTEILDYLYSKGVGKKKAKVKMAAKKLNKRRESLHLDKRGSLRANLDRRHLSSKIETRDEDAMLNDKFTEKQDVVSNHFQQSDKQQMISDRFKTAPEDDAYALEKKQILTNLEKLTSAASSPRDMIIFHEILSLPKSLR